MAVVLLRKPAAIASRVWQFCSHVAMRGSLWMGAPLEVLCLTFDLYIMKAIFFFFEFYPSYIVFYDLNIDRGRNGFLGLENYYFE